MRCSKVLRIRVLKEETSRKTTGKLKGLKEFKMFSFSKEYFHSCLLPVK